MEAKLKHLEFVQSAIDRMAKNSSLYKGWAITIAAGLYALGASNGRTALLLISVISTSIFWGLDAYYLWLERCFICLYQDVAQTPVEQITFAMSPIKHQRWHGRLGDWLKTLARPHLLSFYGLILAVEILGIFLLNGDDNGSPRFFQL